MKKFTDEEKQTIETFVEDLFTMVGDTTDRASTKRTPERVADSYAEILAHTGETEFDGFTLFDSQAENDQVMVTKIPFYSMCEHHLLPFFGEVSVAYIPDKKVVGLSKIPRLVDWASKRPSIQEDITNLIANQLNHAVGAKGVAVSISARHTCVEMRGIAKVGTITNTQKFLGAYHEDANLKTEFLNQVKNG
jgi:GTP cyclohydrolase I